jgi:type I restriction enzyme S subunit
LQRTAPEIHEQYRRAEVRPGDLVFSLRGDIGQSSIVPKGFPPANLTQGTARISVSNRHDAEFIRYALTGPQISRRIHSIAKGSTFREVSLEQLRELQIAAPSLFQQRKIAEILRTWDEAIAACERIAASERLHIRALSRQFFEPCHPKSGSRPSNWTRFELGDAFTERDETGRDEDPLLSITMSGGVIDRNDVGRKDVSKEDKSSYKLILPGDIGYNTMRMWQGVSGLSTLRGIVSPAYTIVTPDNQNIDARYAAHLFKSRRMVFDFERYSQGLTSDTWNLKYPAFSKIVVFLPPISVQMQEAAVMDACLAEVTVIERLRDAIARQKRGLMQKLLTGEWRVKPEGSNG